MHLDKPLSLEYDPAGHSKHDDALEEGWYHPLWHRVQLIVYNTLSVNRPGAHPMQSEAASLILAIAYVPALHAMQSEDASLAIEAT